MHFALEITMKLVLCILYLFIYSSLSHSNEITFDISTYEYEEVNTSTGGTYFMSDKSNPVFASIGIRNWDEGILNKYKPMLLENYHLLYTYEFTRGDVEYNSASSGTLDRRPYFKNRIEGYIARSINKKLKLFVGVGFRSLQDEGGGNRTSSGGVFYDRHSKYLYYPLGLIYNYKSWSLKSQYNLWGEGKQKSFLGKEDSTYLDPENTQNYGYGFDFTLRKKVTEKISIYLFDRYWSVDDSDWRNGKKDQSAIVQEPQNETFELGGGISYKF